MRRIAVGMQEGDDDPFAAHGAHAPYGRAHRFLVQGCVLAAIEQHAAGNGKDLFAGHQGHGPAGK